MRSGDHLIARAYAHHLQRNVDRVGAIGTGHAVVDSIVCGISCFKTFYSIATDERGMLDNIGDGRIDHVAVRLVLGTQVNKRDFHTRYSTHAPS